MATRMLNLNNLTSSFGASLANPLRPKKKYHFQVTLTLQELINCTFVSGVLFAKLQLKDGGQFNGTSHRSDVEHHSVLWDEEFSFSCKMYANSNTMILEPCYCKISVRKETKGGKSCTKLGYIKINLAEFAGQGNKERKYLLHSYNESKRVPDNSLLKVKMYLRQTSGDIVFKTPETKPNVWEEDEGFHDDWLSVYSKGTPRTSNGSMMSSFSIATGSTFSSHSGSAGNLKDSINENNKDGGKIDELNVPEEDVESGSEETIVGGQSSLSQVTVDTVKTGSSRNSNDVIIKGQKNVSPLPSPVHSGYQSVSPTRSQSAGVLPSTTSFKHTSHLSPSAPILEDHEPIDTCSGSFHRGSDPYNVVRMWNNSSQEEIRYSKDAQSNRASLKLPPTNPVSSGRRPPKAGASVQTSRVTAMPGGIVKSHHRQASMGVYHHSPSPLTAGGHHKRHNSFSNSINTEMQETFSMHSTKTRVSTLSTLEQSRADNDSVIANLFATQDLTPASDDELESNLKLYIDKHGGGVTIVGHNLDDKHRFKEVDVVGFTSDNPKHHRKHRKIIPPEKTTPSDHSQSSSDSSSSVATQ